MSARDARIPSGSYQGRTLGSVLDLDMPGSRAWLRWAAEQPWSYDQEFKDSLLHLLKENPLPDSPLAKWMYVLPASRENRVINTEFGQAEIPVLVCAGCGITRTKHEYEGVWIRVEMVTDEYRSSSRSFCGRKCLLDALTDGREVS